MSKIKKFDYEGQGISFEFSDGNRMINATEMARPFGKLVGHFLALKGTKGYILLLEERYRDSDNGDGRAVLRVVQGGRSELQGTWMEEKLALKFAAWLAPSFELWVYDRVEELLATGRVELKGYEPSGIIRGLRMIVEQLEEQDRINQEVRVELDDVADRIADMEAKIMSIDERYYTVAGYCALCGVACPLDKARGWGYAATKLSHQRGLAVGKAYDAKYEEVNTYHEEVLAVVIGK